MTAYTVIAQPAPGIARLRSAEFGAQLWTLGRSRKDAACAHCQMRLPARTETWRPLTNANNRMDRIGAACLAFMGASA